MDWNLTLAVLGAGLLSALFSYLYFSQEVDVANY